MVFVVELVDCFDVVLLFSVELVFQNAWIDVNKQDRKQTSFEVSKLTS